MGNESVTGKKSENQDNPSLLIVEDESLVAQDLKLLLEKYEYEVLETVSTGEEALDLIERTNPDIILMDIMLDGEKTGIDVVKELGWSSPPVVYLTAHTDEETLDRAKQTNPLGYLTKPINEADLRTTLEIALQRKETVNELKLKEQAMASVSEGITIAEAEGDENPLRYVNEGFVDMTGYSRDEVLGDDCRFLQGEATSQETRQEIREAIDNQEPVNTVILNYRKNGEPFWNELSITPIRNEKGEVTHYVGIQKDVTERYEREKNLKVMDRALDSTKEGIIITEATGGRDNPIIDVNSGFEEISGYSLDEIRGEDCRFLQGPETSQEKVDRLREAIDAEEPISLEILNYTKNGEKFWNHLSITPVRNAEGNLTHYIGIMQDVTEQKQKEKELRQSQKLAAIGEMAAGLMHEINNPNAFIQGNIEFIQKGWNRLQEAFGPVDDAELGYFVDELDDTIDAVRQGTKRIERIVNKVKLFARQKTSVDDFDTFDPVQAVENAFNLLSDERFEDWTHVNKEQELVENDYKISADRSGLKQVVTNLVENALDAVEDVEEPQVRINMGVNESRFELVVSDNGEGIPEDVQNKIFDPFFTTKQTGEGTGLGLSIVQGIIDRSGGKIDLESSPGEGTTFTVSLPLHED